MPIILDCETTGFQDPRPVEIAYFRLPEFKVLREFKLRSSLESVFDLESDFDLIFNSRFNPKKPISSEASKIHGIWPKDVRDKPPYTDFELPDMEYLVGHNINYDYRVLGSPKIKLICTKTIANKVIPKDERPNLKLVSLTKHLYPTLEGIKEGAHGALFDCYLTYLLLVELVDRLPKAESYEDLYSLCSGINKHILEQNP